LLGGPVGRGLGPESRTNHDPVLEGEKENGQDIIRASSSKEERKCPTSAKKGTRWRKIVGKNTGEEGRKGQLKRRVCSCLLLGQQGTVLGGGEKEVAEHCVSTKKMEKRIRGWILKEREVSGTRCGLGLRLEHG